MKKVLSILRNFEGYDDSFFYTYLNQLSSNNEIELVNFDDTAFVQFHVGSVKSRSFRYLMRNEQVILFNDAIKKYIRIYKPDIFIFFKANFLHSSTVELARKHGAQIFAIYPDLEPKVHSEDYLRVLKLSDLLIHTKPNLVDYFKTLNENTICVYPFISERNLKNISTYDEEVGISFIGHHSNEKQNSINAVISSIDENITLYGENWNTKINSRKKLNINGAVFGPPVYTIYQKSLFVLGLLTEKLNGFKEGDVITARSVQIPAYGGLVLHPRNSFSEALFGKNHNMLYKDLNDVSNIHKTLKKDLGLRDSLFKEQQSIIIEKATKIETLINAIINYEKSDFNYFNIYK